MVTAQRISELNELMQDTGLSVVWNIEPPSFLLRLSDTEKSTVDLWWQLIQTLADEWDTTQPFNSVYVFEDGVSLMSNYAREVVTVVANEIDRLYPTLHGKIAIVIPPTAQARFLRVFVQTIIYYGPHNFHIQIFNNRDAALHWMAA